MKKHYSLIKPKSISIRSISIRLFLYFISIIPEPFYGLIVKIYNLLQLKKNPEKNISLGDTHSDIQVYLINKYILSGVGGKFNHVLGYLNLVVKKNYQCFVDLSGEIYNNQKDNDNIEANIWDLYFNQPSKLSLKDIKTSKNVIIANPNLHTHYTRYNKKNIKRRNETLNVYFPNGIFNNSVYSKIITNYNSIIDRNKEYIGIAYRGTDYKTNGNWQPVGHPKVPDIDILCTGILKKFSKKCGCDNFFFMTEEQEALDSFIKHFPNAIYLPRYRYENFEYGVSIVEQKPKYVSMFEKDISYLSEIYILSRCTYLIGTYNGGIEMALTLNNNKYKKVKIIDLGKTT